MSSNSRVDFLKSRAAEILLFLLMVFVGVISHASGRLEARVVPDSVLYTDFPMGSLKEALTNHRTPLYPIFLRLLRPFAEEYQAVPYAQYIVYCLAVFVFYAGLRSFASHKLRCAVIAATLLTSGLLFQFVGELGSDCLGASFAIAALGFALIWFGQKNNGTVAAAICISTTFAWLTRPVYLFLILLIPFVDLCTRRSTDDADTPGKRFRPGLILGVAVILPIIAYCSMQWLVVGRFAVVSLGGYNLIGISGQFLDEQSLEELPQRLHPLAKKVLEKRREFQHNLAMPDADRLNYLRMEYQYDDHLWRIAVPAAEEHLGHDAHDRVNSELKDLAVSLIRVRPESYLIWLAKAFRRGMEKIVSDLVLNPASLALLLVTTAVLFAGMLTMIHGRGQPVLLSTQTGFLFLITVLFVGMNLLVVILVSIPIGRLTAPMGLLPPAVVMAFLADLIATLASKRRAPTPPGETPSPRG